MGLWCAACVYICKVWGCACDMLLCSFGDLLCNLCTYSYELFKGCTCDVCTIILYTELYYCECGFGKSMVLLVGVEVSAW